AHRGAQRRLSLGAAGALAAPLELVELAGDGAFHDDAFAGRGLAVGPGPGLLGHQVHVAADPAALLDAQLAIAQGAADAPAGLDGKQAVDGERAAEAAADARGADRGRAVVAAAAAHHQLAGVERRLDPALDDEGLAGLDLALHL